MKRLLYTDKEFKQVISESFSIAEVIKKLGLVAAGGNYKTIKTLIKKLNCNTNHFTGQGHLKGKTHNWNKKSILDEILIENSLYSNTNLLKKRLIKEGFLILECHECKLKPCWNNKFLVLVLDHINGKNNDNRINNLRLLCPNCHSQTITYAGRNKKKKDL